MLIVKPTTREMSLPMRSALPGSKLDTAIEASEMKDMFFVKMSSFVEATIAKSGCPDTIQNRKKIRRAFIKASMEIIKQCVEIELQHQ